MSQETKYLLVDTKVLPDVFLKVVEAKKLLAQGKAGSYTQAALMAGISRSALYKYKDYVFVQPVSSSSTIVTLSLMLNDEPGVLSQVLTALYQSGANVLTINQSIPVDSVAPVSMSVRIDGMKVDLGTLVEGIQKIYGVVHVKTLNAD